MTAIRNRSNVIVSAALTVALLPILAISQQRGSLKPAPATRNRNSERVQRAQAATLLVETADKARTFSDLFYRARIQMLAADALWPYDVRQARAIFRRAWEAATASDTAEREESEREWGTISGIKPDFSEARHEVLRTAAARDARLGETFLRDLVGERDEKSAARSVQSRRNIRRELNTRRLALASELLEAGETLRATEIAAPLVDGGLIANEGISTDLIAFILRLRARSVNDADALYLRLLRGAAAAHLTNAQDVLLLSTYVISPSLMVVVDDFGVLQFRALPRTDMISAAQQAVPQNIQTGFYSLAAAVLTRALPPRDTLTMHELMAQFYATGRLLPYFENPAGPYVTYAPALRARHSELFNEIEASRREQVSSQFSLNSLTRAGYVDPLRSQTDQLAQASSSPEREKIALSIVKIAVRNKYWDRARRAAAEIEDAGRRRNALSFIQIQQIKDILHAYEDQKEDDFESVAKFVRDADVPPFAKAWGFAQTAVIAARKRGPDTSRNVSALIDETEIHASRVAQGSLERVVAFGVATTAASRLDAVRAWDLLREYVKAANAVEDFTGDDATLPLLSDTDQGDEAGEMFYVESEVFRLDGIFATMASLDFNKALEEARNLKDEIPQAVATIALAKTRIQETESRNQKKRQ